MSAAVSTRGFLHSIKPRSKKKWGDPKAPPQVREETTVLGSTAGNLAATKLRVAHNNSIVKHYYI
jgi:hypothetical protein